MALNDTVAHVQYGRQEKNNVFENILTQEGVCFTFNMLPGETLFPRDTFHASRNYLNYKNVRLQWSLHGGYQSDSHIDGYPLRGVGSGNPSGLRIFLEVANEDLDQYCKLSVQGYKIQLHGVADIPRPDQQAIWVPLNVDTRVAVEPHEVIADKDMKKSYTPQQRQCYFPNERPLRFFLQYTQSNCRLECLANFTLQKCGCVSFYMPRDQNTLICAGERAFCGYEAEEELQRAETGFEEDTKVECDCLQSCAFVKYNTEQYNTPKDPQKLNKLLNEEYNLPTNTFGESETEITIHFKEVTYIPYRRTELYTMFDIIANCGGLLGLCLGMSVLSFVEILYWFLIRSCWRRRNIKTSCHSLPTVKGNDIVLPIYWYPKETCYVKSKPFHLHPKNLL